MRYLYPDIVFNIQKFGDNLSTGKSVGVIGWYEGLAGLIDSWLPETGYEVKYFFTVNNEHEQVDTSAHIRYGNKQFSYPSDGKYKNRPLIEDAYWYTNASAYDVDGFIVALDDNAERVHNISEAAKRGVPLFNAIHPTAILMKDSVIGKNCVIHAKALIGYKVILGNGVIINTGSQLDHHVVAEDGVRIDPGCVLASNVLIKKCATLHTSTTVINKIVIGENSVTGAGSVIIRDVPANTRVAGVPARQI